VLLAGAGYSAFLRAAAGFDTGAFSDSFMSGGADSILHCHAGNERSGVRSAALPVVPSAFLTLVKAGVYFFDLGYRGRLFVGASVIIRSAKSWPGRGIFGCSTTLQTAFDVQHRDLRAVRLYFGLLA